MWCWNRCITETTLGWTSAEQEVRLLPAVLPVSLSVFPYIYNLHSHHLTFKRAYLEDCMFPIMPNLSIVEFSGGSILMAALLYAHSSVSFSLSVFLLTKDGQFFLHPPFHFPQCCFCFFLAVQTNICFVRVTSHIPNHIESCSQRQQTGADPEIQPRQAYIKQG